MPGSQVPNCRLLPTALLTSLLLAEVRSLELYSLVESATLGLKERFFSCACSASFFLSPCLSGSAGRNHFMIELIRFAA